jgi:outer membrane protein OmpA-like peptidoglycan-associated protein
MPNQELSEERAKAVKDWLVRHGISPDRLLAKGFGASRPFVPNDSNAHMALNRRTEIKVL